MKTIEVELIRKSDINLLRNKVKAFKVCLQDLEDSLDMFFEEEGLPYFDFNNKGVEL